MQAGQRAEMVNAARVIKEQLIPGLVEADSRGGGFPNRLNFDSPERTEGGSPWRQRLVFGMTMTPARFWRRRNDRRTVRKREDSWLLRRSTTGPRAPRRRRSAASDDPSAI